MSQINEPTDTILAARARWTRNRAFLSGEDAVKAGGELYLKKLANQTDADYKSYLFRVPFFAGAARVREGLKGLIFRKPMTVVVPQSLEPIFDTITPAGHTLNDLAEDLVDETLTTGYTGLLIDHPQATEGLTLANAIESGFRPFIAVYPAESILEVTAAVVGNVQKVVRVRLQDDDDTVRELVLDNNVYTVIIHARAETGEWVPQAPVIPLKRGKTINEIPFVLVGESARRFAPGKGPLDDVVQSNKHAYMEGANAQNSRYYSSAPILTITGAKVDDLTISPATVLQFPEATPENPVEVKFAEFSGAGQSALESAYKEQKEEMAMLGLRMLATEAKGVEASETHAIRRASENSILAALARRVSDRLEDAAKWVAWWMDNSEEIAINLSTDFLPTPMDAAEMKEWREAFLAGVISFDTLCERLMDGEKLPEDFDIEAERERKAGDTLDGDRPAPATPEGPTL